MVRSRFFIMGMCLLIISLLAGGEAFAQANQNVDRQATDGKNVKQSQQSGRENRANLDRLSDLMLRWDNLRRAGDAAGLSDVQKNILAEMRRDIAEFSKSTVQTRGEKANDQSSKGDDRIKPDEDDDLMDADWILKRKRDIARELVILQTFIDTGGDRKQASLDTQNDLLLEYLAISRQEVQLGYRESVEYSKEPEKNHDKNQQAR